MTKSNGINHCGGFSSHFSGVNKWAVAGTLVGAGVLLAGIFSFMFNRPELPFAGRIGLVSSGGIISCLFWMHVSTKEKTPHQKSSSFKSSGKSGLNEW